MTSYSSTAVLSGIYTRSRGKTVARAVYVLVLYDSGLNERRVHTTGFRGKA